MAEESFLHRWSRRKRAANGEPSAAAESVPDGAVFPVAATEGKESPFPQRDEGLWRGSETHDPLAESARFALRVLLHGAEFNRGDGLNEYDGDYTCFAPRGDLLTQDMLRGLERLAEAAESPPPEPGQPPESPPEA